MALPNGLEMIVSFLAASAVGAAAPLNPAYGLDEFKFYLEDTGARALIIPPTGSDEARAAVVGSHSLSTTLTAYKTKPCSA
jgi:acyl-CoA synthetase (AMP-forming)/AMP-acid ligase II